MTGSVTWSGKIDIPPLDKQHRIRIVLKEFERFNVTNDVDMRLVYANALPLPLM